VRRLPGLVCPRPVLIAFSWWWPDPDSVSEGSLNDGLGVKLDSSIDPMTVVARGAAIFAPVSTGRGGRTFGEHWRETESGACV